MVIGRADNARTRIDRLFAPDTGEGALLEQAQQLRLHRERQLTDLVEKQDPITGALDISVMSGLGAGEGALLVAEQLALDQFAGNRRAIDRNKGLIGARRVLVNKTCRDLLADAALAGEQQR